MATLWKFILALAVTLPALVQADRIEAQELFITPSERVTRFVNVRELSSSDSDVIARLGPGERLPLMDSGPGWREVRLDDGRSGFVSKSWTVVVPGPPPGGEQELRIHFLSIGVAVVEPPALDHGAALASRSVLVRYHGSCRRTRSPVRPSRRSRRDVRCRRQLSP
jgi:hypothetical protein